MMALFVAVTGAIVVGAAYLSKKRAHQEMEQQRAEEAAFKKKVAEFRAKMENSSEGPDRPLGGQGRPM